MPVTRHLILRADAATNIGNGHIVRCLALAAAWKQAGGEAIFIVNTDNADLKGQICSAGHSLRCLPCSHPHSADLAATLAAAQRSGASWIVLDGYHFDHHYHAAIKQAGFGLMVIDDNAHLPRYDADLILNQNLHSPELHYIHGPATRLLPGPRYALLRPEFTASGAQARTWPTDGIKVLVTMGGSDRHNVTAVVIQALNRLPAAPSETRIVVGPGNPHCRELEALLRTSVAGIELVTASHQAEAPNRLKPPRSMSELMAGADIAISAAGSTCWELACIGLPALLIVTADNQHRIASSLDRAGIARNLGWYADATPRSIADALESLRSDWRCRQSMSELGRCLVDGHGAKRIVDILLRDRS